MPPTFSPSSASRYILYVGSYDKGIHGFEYHSDGQTLTPLGILGEIANPSFLAIDPQHRYLYAVSEVEGDKDGGVGAFSIDSKNGKLKKLNTASSSGVAPCHLAVDKTSRLLTVANYMSGGVAAFHLERDGSIGALTALATATGSSVNKARQTAPHAHQVVFSENNQFLYVPDLGLDQIRIYNVLPEDGKLAPHLPPTVGEKAGFGPRHMAFSRDDAFAYLLTELQSYVVVYKHDPKTASFERIQEISSLPGDPENRDGGAEILVHPTGNFVYASNRGPGSIAVFKRDPNSGTLRHVQTVKVNGTMPRGMEFDPSGHFLLVGDQKANHISTFKIDTTTGELYAVGKDIDSPSPVAFLFVPLL